MKCSFVLKIVVAAVIANLCPLSATSQTPGISDTGPRALVQKARGSTAVVTGEDRAGQPIAPGLGFVIGRNLIATHNRVIVPALAFERQPREPGILPDQDLVQRQLPYGGDHDARHRLPAR